MTHISDKTLVIQGNYSNKWLITYNSIGRILNQHNEYIARSGRVYCSKWRSKYLAFQYEVISRLSGSSGPCRTCLDWLVEVGVLGRGYHIVKSDYQVGLLIIYLQFKSFFSSYPFFYFSENQTIFFSNPHIWGYHASMVNAVLFNASCYSLFQRLFIPSICVFKSGCYRSFCSQSQSLLGTPI